MENQQEHICSICLDTLDNNDIIKTNCNHIFHKSCLINWTKNCPICRHEYLETYAWYSQKQFEYCYKNKKFPYIYYNVYDSNNNEKVVQITEIGKKNLFSDAKCLGKIIRFNCASKDYIIF